MVDLKELKKLVKYLRKEGITEFKEGTLELKLPHLAPKPRKISKEETDIIQDAIDSDYPTAEELLFYSAGGIPEKPERN